MCPRAIIVNGDSLAVTPPWHYISHCHRYWEFIYFTRGVGRVDIPHPDAPPIALPVTYLSAGIAA